eukprot:NODE_51_length_27121_cov_0.309452.p3 type:complete len:626 gc:universal NODE_51_length_27121_cov_0.309452:23531-25408(+)
MKRSIPVSTGIPKPSFKRQKLEPAKPTKSQIARDLKTKANLENQANSVPPKTKPITNSIAKSVAKSAPRRPVVKTSKPVVKPAIKTVTRTASKNAVSTIKNIRSNPPQTTKDQLQNTKCKLLEIQLENQSLSSQVTQLESDVSKHLQEITNLSVIRQKSNDSLKSKQSEIQSLTLTLLDTQESLNSLELQIVQKDSLISNFTNKISSLESKLKSTTDSLNTSNNELAPLKSAHSKLQLEFDALLMQYNQLCLDFKKSQSELNICLAQNTSSHATINKMSIQLESCQFDLNKMTTLKNEHEKRELLLESKLFEADKLKRYLHNQVMELKGNIRVFCRVRPFLKHEKDEPKKSKIEFTNDGGLIFKEPETSHDGQFRYKDHYFTYDKVFNQQDDQEQVFKHVEQLCQSALDGYNVCIFAYGVTSSGKTFTMQGNDKQLGMIPRAIDLIFSVVPELEVKGWKFKLQIMYVEIYNETINDLISTFNRRKPKNKPDVRILKNTTEILNCNIVDVTTKSQVNELIEEANKTRSVGSTNSNEHSSRSHSVFTLLINGINSTSNEEINGSLNLVDLAGSERLQHSKSEGQRLKETQSINKSLSALGDVISALAKNEGHVPYRNSKVAKTNIVD